MLIFLNDFVWKIYE